VVGVVGYLPIITTVVALFFAAQLVARYRERRGLHHVWWAIGMLTYAAGTLTESLTTLTGWHEAVFRAWYITGALLGGAPLAQGTVYLFFSRRSANRLTALVATVVLVAATCVILSPIDYSAVQPYRLTGRVLEWHWVRLFSPFINLYAVTFLIGGAIVSALRYRKRQQTYHRYVGNLLIAFGALLPGIGGAFTRFGHTEVLYVTELIGLLFIYAGFRFNTAPAVVEMPVSMAPG
jgi:general stress protein CsbA